MGVAWHVESGRAGWGSSRQEGRAGPGGGASGGCLVLPGPTCGPRTVWGYLPASVSIRLFLSGFDCVSWTLGLPDPTYSTVPIRLYHPGMIVLRSSATCLLVCSVWVFRCLVISVYLILLVQVYLSRTGLSLPV